MDLSSFLGTMPKTESDIEGAATLGSKIFWITSHGTNSNGEVQDRRRKLFATEILGRGVAHSALYRKAVLQTGRGPFGRS